jgi:hypothetical protein
MQQHAVTSVRCVAAWLFLLATSPTSVLCILAREAPALQRGRKSFKLTQARILIRSRAVSSHKRKMLFHPDYAREKIRASQLINRLHKCAFGEISLTMTQLRAIEILLRKCLVASSRRKLRTNSVTRNPSTSLSCRWQTFAPPLSALPKSSAR